MVVPRFASLTLIAILIATPGALPARPAFPGAVGYGAGSLGGRGGRVIPVTTLADSGRGSLRACIEASGPRVCVFRVSGVIRFTRQRPIIRHPRLTIAGETAPGDGILLTHAGGPDGFTPIVIKNSSDVVIRHIRVRTDVRGDIAGSNGAFTIEGSRDVILDHVSGSWALDQNLSGHGGNDRITVSWSIFAEGIPPHDKCALLASDPPRPQKFTLFASLCAHNGDRNPDANFPPGSCVEIGNNVFYNAQSQFAEIWESEGGTPVSIVDNVFRRGPNTVDAAAAIDQPRFGARGGARIYQRGNLVTGSMALVTTSARRALVAEPPCPLQMRTTPADEAYVRVLRRAGALPRDAVDRRLAREVITRTGSIVKSPGTLPTFRSARPYPDRDLDGMDDRWEAANGARPGHPDPWEDADGDGWLNLETFLDWRHRQLVAAAEAQLPAREVRASLKGQRPAS